MRTKRSCLRFVSTACASPLAVLTPLLLVVSVLMPAAALAQSATNTSGIEGKVTDESGAVLPGVTVTIASLPPQAPQMDGITDESGRYRSPRRRAASIRSALCCRASRESPART